ncbi:MAG: acetyl-CoA carboxylase carboxyl transferase subunit alpha, partial [Planctomycetes bacterium]|nr:acetyl-CoA carboxylase carboxyl transferase subunit alpha [Planctomycetota bacterium]
GEGGSGGALGIGVGDRFAIMQFAWYTVASPEACAAILWKNGENAHLAAEALKLTSDDLHKLGVVDHIVPEPLGGAHRNPHEASRNLESYLVKTIRDLRRCKIENLLENRYRKIRSVGELSTKTKKKSPPSRVVRTDNSNGNIKAIPAKTTPPRKPIQT